MVSCTPLGEEQLLPKLFRVKHNKSSNRKVDGNLMPIANILALFNDKFYWDKLYPTFMICSD